AANAASRQLSTTRRRTPRLRPSAALARHHVARPGAASQSAGVGRPSRAGGGSTSPAGRREAGADIYPYVDLHKPPSMREGRMDKRNKKKARDKERPSGNYRGPLILKQRDTLIFS